MVLKSKNNFKIRQKILQHIDVKLKNRYWKCRLVFHINRIHFDFNRKSQVYLLNLTFSLLYDFYQFSSLWRKICFNVKVKFKLIIVKKLFVGLAFAGSLFINAQEKTKSSSPITFGVKAGFNATTISRNDDNDGYYDNDQKMKAGFNAGVFVHIPVAEKFSVQPELLFSQLGAKSETKYRYTEENQMVAINGTDKLNLNYLVLPVMVQYNILPQLYVEAGPEFGFLLGGKSKGDVTIAQSEGNFTSYQSEKFSDKINMDRFNRFNFGVGIGAGYYFTPQFGVTARFTAGLTNIMKDSFDAFKARNNAFQVGVAYKFK